MLPYPLRAACSAAHLSHRERQGVLFTHRAHLSTTAKLFLDKAAQMVYNKHILHIQTIEAEVKLQAHPQRVPAAESGAKSGAANGPLRAVGTGVSLSIF